MEVKIEESWRRVLQQELTAPYFLQIVAHLKMERDLKKVLYPNIEQKEISESTNL